MLSYSRNSLAGKIQRASFHSRSALLCIIEPGLQLLESRGWLVPGTKVKVFLEKMTEASLAKDDGKSSPGCHCCHRHQLSSLLGAFFSKLSLSLAYEFSFDCSP